MKNLLKSMIEIELSLEINLEKIDMFLMSYLTSNEHRLCLHYCAFL